MAEPAPPPYPGQESYPPQEGYPPQQTYGITQHPAQNVVIANPTVNSAPVIISAGHGTVNANCGGCIFESGQYGGRNGNQGWAATPCRIIQIVVITLIVVGIIVTVVIAAHSTDDEFFPFPFLPIIGMLSMSLFFFTCVYCAVTCSKARHPHSCEEKKGGSIFC